MPVLTRFERGLSSASVLRFRPRTAPVRDEICYGWLDRSHPLEPQMIGEAAIRNRPASVFLEMGLGVFFAVSLVGLLEATAWFLHTL